ncbi:MAG: 2Fe-2S iron-sulfur cluster-binding protein [Crocinitomicaceae bacterium]
MKPKFHTLTIKDIQKETADTVSISFNIPEDLKENYQFIPGQYLTLKAMLDGNEVRRSYSICSALSENELRVAVKEVKNGLFSTYANTQLSVGDELEVMTPEGGFNVRPNSGNANTYVFYAAGSGITPVLSMIKSLLEKEDNSKVFLYYGNRSKEETIFRNQLDQLAEKYDNFKLHYILSRENTSHPMTSGRIDADKCAHFFNEELADLKIEGIYTCGPEEMIECVKDFYISKGLLHKVHFELFTTPATAAAEQKVDTGANVVVESDVTVIIDDEKFQFKLKSNGKDVLSAAQDQDADVPFSCKGGVCCTCRAKLLEGKVKMDLNFALEDDEVEQGFILTCQSHPITEKVVISYDEY